MAYCTNCGKELPDDAKFCSNCGKEIPGCDFDDGVKTGKYDIEVKPKIRLYGPRDAKTEVNVFIPQHNRSMRVIIPNFVELGQSIRVRREGLPNPDGSVGDLLITPSEIECYDTEITTAISLRGAENAITKLPLYLPHTKKTVHVSVPNNIERGKTLRIKGLGLDVPDGSRGDLYLHFSERF